MADLFSDVLLHPKIKKKNWMKLEQRNIKIKRTDRKAKMGERERKNIKKLNYLRHKIDVTLWRLNIVNL